MIGVQTGDPVSKVFIEACDGYIVFLLLIFPFSVPINWWRAKNLFVTNRQSRALQLFQKNNNAGDI